MFSVCLLLRFSLLRQSMIKQLEKSTAPPLSTIRGRIELILPHLRPPLVLYGCYGCVLSESHSHLAGNAFYFFPPPLMWMNVDRQQSLPRQTVFLSRTSQVVHRNPLGVGRGLDVVWIRYEIRKTCEKEKKRKEKKMAEIQVKQLHKYS